MSYISVTSQSAGRAEELAASRKRDKYVDFAKNHLFVPITAESLDPLVLKV